MVVMPKKRLFLSWVWLSRLTWDILRSGSLGQPHGRRIAGRKVLFMKMVYFCLKLASIFKFKFCTCKFHPTAKKLSIQLSKKKIAFLSKGSKLSATLDFICYTKLFTKYISGNLFLWGKFDIKESVIFYQFIIIIIILKVYFYPG